jgi:hypothetical protein
MGSSISSVRSVVVVLAVALCGGRVQAAAPAANATAQELARAKLVDGVELLRRGAPASALTAFQEAYALVPSPKIKYDFGLAYLGLRRDAEALSAFEQFLAEAPDAPADKRRRAEQYRDTLRARLATTAAEPAPPPVAPVAPSQPAAPAPLSAGSTPAIAAGSTAPPSISARTWALSAGIASVALLGAGVTFGLLAHDSGQHLTDLSHGSCAASPCSFDPSAESSGRTYETLQVTFLISGAVAAVGAAVLYAVGRPQQEQRLTARPLLAPGLAGGTVQVSF